jgi:hypothetical protein
MKFIKNKHINKHDLVPPLPYIDLSTLFGYYEAFTVSNYDDVAED